MTETCKSASCWASHFRTRSSAWGRVARKARLYRRDSSQSYVPRTMFELLDLQPGSWAVPQDLHDFSAGLLCSYSSAEISTATGLPRRVIVCAPWLKARSTTSLSRFFASCNCQIAFTLSGCTSHLASLASSLCSGKEAGARLLPAVPASCPFTHAFRDLLRRTLKRLGRSPHPAEPQQ